MSLPRLTAMLFFMLPVLLFARQSSCDVEKKSTQMILTQTISKQPVSKQPVSKQPFSIQSVIEAFNAMVTCNDHSNPNHCSCSPSIDQIEDVISMDGEKFVISFLDGKGASNYFWEVEMNNVLGAEAGGGKIIEQSLCIVDARFEAFVDYEIFPRNNLCVGNPIFVRVYVQKMEETYRSSSTVQIADAIKRMPIAKL